MILLVVAFIFFGCNDRDRLNPIDPLNPETAGRPQLLKIYSEFDRVVLQWHQLQLNGIQGYRIYRKADSDLTFKPIGMVPPDSNRYIDKGVAYETRYHYFMTVVGGDFETTGSDTLSIIPGPTIIWATDVYNRRLLKISHDGSHEITQIPVDGYPWALAYDNENEVLWYTDVLLNRVYRVISQSFEMVLNLSYGERIELLLDKSNDRVWVADETQGKIFVFNRGGEKIGEVGGFQQPVSIDCVNNDGSCWVADSKAKTITKLSARFQTAVKIKHLIQPTGVSVNQSNGDCWVADSSRVLKYDNRGRLQLIITSSINVPRYLAVDSVSGNCWVLDFSLYQNQSRLFCFNNDGDKLYEIKGLTWPANLKINPYDQSCIVTDSGAGRILKITKHGNISGQIADYNYTRGLFIEF